MFVELAPQPIVLPTTVVVTRPRVWHRVLSTVAPYLYMLPAIAIFAFWIYRPLIQTLQYSFDDWNLLPTTPRVGVGWANYKTLFHLTAFWQSLLTTAFFIGGLLVFGVLLPLIIGGLSQQVGKRSQSFYRGVLFLPVLVSPLVAAAIWNFLLAPNGGLVNTVTGWFGASPQNWLFSPTDARFSIVIIAGWKVLGVSVLIVAAGLAAINTDYYDAAAIDGASRLRTFREVTLPLLSPSLLFLVITAVLVGEAQIIFPLLTTLTEGGPGTSTTDIYYLLYSNGFQSFDVGLAAAGAVIFFILFATVGLVAVWLLDRFSFHDN